MNWTFGIILILVIVIYLINHQLQKIKYQKFKKACQENWGKPKEDTHYSFEVINQYFQNSKNKENAYHVLSNQLRSDLDIDDLFTYLDRTSSKIGQQYLYYKINVIESREQLLEFEKLTTLFETDASLRLSSQLELAKLNTSHSYDLETLIHDKPIAKPSYQKFLIPLAITALLAFSLGFVNPVFFLVLMPVFMVNLVLHYKTKGYINYYLSAVTQLIKALKVSEKLAEDKAIKKHFSKLNLKELQKIRLKIKFISFEKQLDMGFAIILWSIIELIKIMFNIEAIIFYSFIDSIVAKRKDIDKLFQFIGEIDSAISVAAVRYQNPAVCKPKFTENNTLNIQKITHPLITNCVSNSIILNGKSVLLTGSNMSGKTTFIRMIAVNSIMAETLNIAFAEEFTIPFYKVYSAIKIADSLLDDTSYYLQEVLTIKKLITVSQGEAPCLFVLDEIFKGTNTVERIAGGKAILSYLNKGNKFVFVSTHDIELTDLLAKDNFELYHFSEQIINNELHFDHKLKKGKLQTRNAIKILELYNYPKEIINVAEQTIIDNKE